MENTSEEIKGEDYYNSGSWGAKFRRARLEKLVLPLLEDISRCKGNVRVLDLGGNVQYWEPILADLRRLACRVSLLNLSNDLMYKHRQADACFEFLTGDARRCDYPDNSFDLVHSNSVIEHVGTWVDMQAMANEVRRLAPLYYLQVPNFWFPMEPHFRRLFFHWLPEQVRARMVSRRALGFMPKASSYSEAMAIVESARLLEQSQLAELFPDSTISKERVFGLAKSLIAIRR
jgi:ubiquinone/menaquinone biosynthesis C-methylase UbiE